MALGNCIPLRSLTKNAGRHHTACKQSTKQGFKLKHIMRAFQVLLLLIATISVLAETLAPTPAVGSNPVCNICGDPTKIVAFPDIKLSFPGFSTLTCSQLVKAGLSGQISSLACPWLSTASGVVEVCGCAVANSTTTPFLASSAAPTPTVATSMLAPIPISSGSYQLQPATLQAIAPSPVHTLVTENLNANTTQAANKKALKRRRSHHVERAGGKVR